MWVIGLDHVEAPMVAFDASSGHAVWPRKRRHFHENCMCTGFGMDLREEKVVSRGNGGFGGWAGSFHIFQTSLHFF